MIIPLHFHTSQMIRQQIIEQMQPYIALGVVSFLLDCGGFPNLTTLELLVHDVLPVVAKEPL